MILSAVPADDLERALAGALRSAIKAHGPIGPENIGSAVKRIVGQLRNARLGTLMAIAGRKRWAGLDQEQRAELAGAGGRKAWAGMTPEQRSEENRKRAAKRKRF